jgi:A/G-specific adenine glycosylase
MHPHRVLVRSLLKWFAVHARDLPWRRWNDPYVVWVSEIMLQQTQVKTVVPYFERWLRAFPNIRVLAEATPARVLKLWEGLGYYTRARNLHAAARIVVKKHTGKFPATFSKILALPGVGRYTAGAICSIAFNQPTPILDGNVIRVLTRRFGITTNPREKSTNNKLWQLAEQLVVNAAILPGKQNCSQLNQALMELGALVCTPRQPRCSDCPLAKGCIAFRQDLVETIPNLGARPDITPRRFVAFVAQDDGRVLVRRRLNALVKARLWEFPNLEVANSNADLIESARELLGTRALSLHILATIRHSITRYRITMEVFRVDSATSLVNRDPSARWYTPAKLKKLTFSSAHRRIVNLLAAKLGQG